MPKAFCIAGMVVAVLVLIIFLLDLALGIPFQGASTTLDVVFMISAAILGYMSWSTYREL